MIKVLNSPLLSSSVLLCFWQQLSSSLDLYKLLVNLTPKATLLQGEWTMLDVRPRHEVETVRFHCMGLSLVKPAIYIHGFLHESLPGTAGEPFRLFHAGRY